MMLKNPFWANVGSTQVVQLPSRLGISSMSTHIMMASTSVSSGVWGEQVQQCDQVDLSTQTGAVCACGAFHMSADALSMKVLSLGDLRQIVGSGYKLVHGWPVQALTWK